MKIAELEVTSNIHGKRIVGVGGWHERKKICISVNVNFFKEKEDKILLILLLLIVIIIFYVIDYSRKYSDYSFPKTA